jgi:hypothetical protein
MFNALLESKNFGGQRSMLTLLPVTDGVKRNVEAMTNLMVSSGSLGTLSLGGKSDRGDALAASSVVFAATNRGVVSFLKAYHWLEPEYPYPERPADTSLQIDFLEKSKHEIETWLVVAPQRQTSYGDVLTLPGVGNLTVKERHREEEGRGFQVFGEPVHRVIANFFAGIDPKPGKQQLTLPNASTKRLRKEHCGVIMLYPVREEVGDMVSIGFELFFPPNSLPFDLNFTVRRKSEKAKIVVDE